MGFDFPQTALVKKKVFAHSSQYDSGHLKDQTWIPVKPENFQVLFVLGCSFDCTDHVNFQK